MKITWTGPGGRRSGQIILVPGNEYEVPDETAQDWIRRGYAEEVKAGKHSLKGKKEVTEDER